MAEGDCTVYQSFWVNVLSKKIDCTADTFKITLHHGYTPSQSHEVFADVSATEYGSGSGYTAGGKQCSSPTVTKAAAIKFDAADPTTWSSLGPVSPATPDYAILWDDTPTSPADPLVCYFALGVTATNGGNYTLAFSANGILTVTA
jgi:hypothetical protein